MCEHNYQKTGKGFVEKATMTLKSIYKCSKCGKMIHKEDNYFEMFNKVIQEEKHEM